MKEYPKIQSVFKRDEKSHKFIEGDWSLPEFQFLKDNLWECTEKINGTSIRVTWNTAIVGFGGKSDEAQIPAFLLKRLQERFPWEKFHEQYSSTPMCLYGEGYGARIQKGGGKYIPDGVDFILFDVLIDGWWLYRSNIEDIGSKLGIKCVPLVCTTTLPAAIEVVKNGIPSRFGDFEAEGLVLKPLVSLFNRKGERIVTKLKGKDFQPKLADVAQR